LALGEGADLVENAGAPANLPSGEPDPGMLIAKQGGAREALPAFIKAIARHRHHEREMDPPLL
jgi:catalase